MKKIIFSAFILANALSAMTLAEIIDASLSKSPSLESINFRIQANKQNVEVANQYANPQILFTKNSLDAKEKMSQTVVTLKQRIPYYSKLDKKQKVAIAQDKVLDEKLRYAQVALVASIKNEAYTIWELTELKKIIFEYITLTKQNVNLYESYVSTSANQHMGIMKAKLSLSDLEIQISILNSKISSEYAKLSYLAAFRVKKLEISLNMENKPTIESLQSSLPNNPYLAMKRREIQRENAKISLADINNYPDFDIMAGYSYRENFDNFVNIGVGISIPMYGTEDLEEERARALALSATQEARDVELSINSQLRVFYSQMTSSYEIYHIIQDEALPQVAHMFELSNSSISTGSDLFKYIDVLFQKLDLEEKSISAVSNYKKALAKISQLAGELK